MADGPTRSLGLPPAAAGPLSLYRDDAALKAHPAYRAAKSGNADAAIRLVRDLARPLCELAARRFAPGAFYVAPHAIEASGENAFQWCLPPQFPQRLRATQKLISFSGSGCSTLAPIRWNG